MRVVNNNFLLLVILNDCCIQGYCLGYLTFLFLVNNYWLMTETPRLFLKK